MNEKQTVMTELKELIKLARKENLKALTIKTKSGADVSFEFGDKPLPRRTRTRKEDRVKEPLAEYSEDDVLGWSVSNYGAE